MQSPNYEAGLLIQKSIDKPKNLGLTFSLLGAAEKTHERVRQLVLIRLWVGLQRKYKLFRKNRNEAAKLSAAFNKLIEVHAEAFDFASEFQQPLIELVNEKVSFLISQWTDPELLLNIATFAVIYRSRITTSEALFSLPAEILQTLCKYKDNTHVMDVLQALVEACEIARQLDSTHISLLRRIIYEALAHVLESNLKANPSLKQDAIGKFLPHEGLFTPDQKADLLEICTIAPLVLKPNKTDVPVHMESIEFKQKSRKHHVDIDLLDIEATVRKLFKRIRHGNGPKPEVWIGELVRSTQEDRTERVFMEVKQIAKKLDAFDRQSMKNFNRLQRLLMEAQVLNETHLEYFSEPPKEKGPPSQRVPAEPRRPKKPVVKDEELLKAFTSIPKQVPQQKRDEAKPEFIEAKKGKGKQSRKPKKAKGKE